MSPGPYRGPPWLCVGLIPTTGLSLIYCLKDSLPLKGIIASSTLIDSLKLYSCSNLDVTISTSLRTLNKDHNQAGQHIFGPDYYSSAKSEVFVETSLRHNIRYILPNQIMLCRPIQLKLWKPCYSHVKKHAKECLQFITCDIMPGTWCWRSTLSSTSVGFFNNQVNCFIRKEP